MTENIPSVTWEHVWIAIQYRPGILGMGAGWDSRVTAQIEELGRRGFELVSVAPVENSKLAQFVLFFKRQIG